MGSYIKHYYVLYIPLSTTIFVLKQDIGDNETIVLRTITHEIECFVLL